nr:uncharacterized protein LOC114821171 [Malus domestica]
MNLDLNLGPGPDAGLMSNDPVNFDLTRDVIHPSEPENTWEAAERTNLLNRILTSRGLRREQNPVVLADDVVDLTQSNVTGVETRENRQLQSLLLKRTQSHRATQSSLSSALSSAESCYKFREPTGHRCGNLFHGLPFNFIFQKKK